MHICLIINNFIVTKRISSFALENKTSRSIMIVLKPQTLIYGMRVEVSNNCHIIIKNEKDY